MSPENGISYCLVLSKIIPYLQTFFNPSSFIVYYHNSTFGIVVEL